MGRPQTLLLGTLLLVSSTTAGWFGSQQPAQADDATKRAAPSEARSSSAGQDANTVHLNRGQADELGIAGETAIAREIVDLITVPGTVAFDDRLVTHLKPRTSGRVLSLAVSPGDNVPEGAVLATIDASSVLDARKGLDAAVAGLGEAKASQAAATIAVTRGSALLKIGGIAKADLENRQVQAARADAAVQSAQAQVNLYRAQYERLAPGAKPGTSEIVSPIKGAVVDERITLGEVVDTNQDAFTVADPSKVLILASVFGFDIGRIKTGDAASIEAPVGPGSAFKARVMSVSPALDPSTNAATARLQVENPREVLKANMFVSVAIQADLGRRGVTIPAAAVQESEQGSIAFVRTGKDTFVKRDLKLGLQRPDWVEVESGVKDGESVATKGSFALKSILLRSLLGSTD